MPATRSTKMAPSAPLKKNKISNNNNGNDYLSKKKRVSSLTSAGGSDTTPDIIFTKSRLLATANVSSKFNERDEETPDQDDSTVDTFNLDNLPSTGTKPPHLRIAPKPDVNSPLPSKYTHNIKPSNKSNDNRLNNSQPRLIPKIDKIPTDYEDLKKAYIDLQTRFDKLTMLKDSEAERLLADFKRKSQARLDAADELVKALKEENSRLKDNSTLPVTPRLSMPISEAQSTTDAKSELELIRGLTGLHLTIKEQEHSWTAAMEGKRGGRRHN